MSIPALPANDRWISYAPSAGQTVFLTDFPLLAPTDLRAYRVLGNVVQMVQHGAGATIDQLTDTNARVTLAAPSVAGEIIVLAGAAPATRSTRFTPAGGLPSDTLETELNRLTIQVQELQRRLDGVIATPPHEAPAGITLPAASQRAGLILGFDGAGNPAAVAPAGLTGAARQATQPEAEGGADVAAWMNPRRTQQQIAAAGFLSQTALNAQIATQAEAEAGTSPSKLMTPQRNRQAWVDWWGEDWSHHAKYFGVVADDNGAGTPTDNTAAMQAYFAQCVATGMPGFFAGNVYCGGAISVDVGARWEAGLRFSGVARLGSRLRFGALPANQAALRIHSSTVQPFVGYPTYDWLGLRMEQLHIRCAHDGPALVIGRDALDGPLNVAVLDQVTVFNSFAGFNVRAIVLRHVVNSELRMCAGNCLSGPSGAPPHYGVGLFLDRVQFCAITSGSFGICDVGLWFNEFTNTVIMNAVNTEAVRIGMWSPGGAAARLRNTGWRTAIITDYAVQFPAADPVDSLALDAFTIDNPAKLLHPADRTGVILRDRGVSAAAPSFAWGTNIPNTTAKVVEVFLLGGSPTGISRNGFNFGVDGRRLILNPGDVYRADGSGSAAMVWHALQP